MGCRRSAPRLSCTRCGEPGTPGSRTAPGARPGRQAQAEGWDGRRDRRPAGRPQKELIERAYRTAEALGLLIWDNLKGHTSWPLVRWCLERGILPLWTPIAGSWLNLAESLQRIVVRRALGGQHAEHTTQLMVWLAEAVVGWNADPTPFGWGGKRAERRRRARERRHRLGGSGGYTRRAIRRCRHKPAYLAMGHEHGN